MNRKFLISLVLLPAFTHAQEALDTIEVTEKKSDSFFEFWEENKGTQIFSGKKNTVTSLKEIPQLQTNNYRQATSQTPGLLISEVPNESLAAITYRGLGDPHESYNLLLLQDGIPVASDMYGYPAHYYSPALPMMQQVQFIRGGAGLLFGPQPGGVLNYISRPLEQNQKLSGQVNVTGGSYDLLATNNAVFGSSGNNSYGIEFYRRQGNGPQRSNSDFHADYVQIRNHTFAGKNKYKVSFNGYNSDHGEPGGFTKETGTGQNTFGGDIRNNTKEHDRLKVNRAQLAVGLEHRFDETSQLDANLWAGVYRRYSKRQNGNRFGQTPTGNNNQINEQNFNSFSGDVRYLKNYSAFGSEHTLSAGVMSYNIDSPIESGNGATVDSNRPTAASRTHAMRLSRVNSAFLENRFAFGNLMITPGMRFENIRQSLRNTTNGTYGEVNNNVPLLGLGVAYHVSETSQVYANFSESYKPLTYSEAVPTTTNEIVEGNIDPSMFWTYELGYRGQTTYLNWDTSVFLINYDNKLAKVDTGNLDGSNNRIFALRNSGRGRHTGVDLAGEFKLSQLFPTLRPMGNFNLYANTAYLEARYTGGPLNGNTPQYAPKNITRTGLIYSNEDQLKIALMGVFSGRHFADDSNTERFEIPYYMVWDLTADWQFRKHWLLSLGINNLFDRQYYSRVRNDGIQWALDRNYYAGVSYQF
jgi:Fe(3+) dicitrate transport protein